MDIEVDGRTLLQIISKDEKAKQFWEKFLGKDILDELLKYPGLLSMQDAKRAKVTKEEKEFTMELWGNYYLSVKGKVIEDNLNLRTQIPDKWNAGINGYPANFLGLCVIANEPPMIYTVDFYDKQKKHRNGHGIVAGNISLLSPTKIHWTLNEEAALFETGIAPIGFSVPIDVIMTKEE